MNDIAAILDTVVKILGDGSVLRRRIAALEATAPTPDNGLDEFGLRGRLVVDTQEASAGAVGEIMFAPQSLDGRSQFFWVRLDDGEVLLATFPRGETYFAHEAERKV